jgi:hypothetical protein
VTRIWIRFTMPDARRRPSIANAPNGHATAGHLATYGVLITTSQQAPQFVARTGTRLVAGVPTMLKAKRSWI